MNCFFKIILFCLIAVNSITITSAQEKATSINGYINDVRNKGIDGITIILKNTNYGAYTDETGYFKITNMKPGAYTLIISGLGFKEQTRNIKLSKNQELVVNVILKEDLTAIDEVVVKGKTKAAKVKEQSFTVNSIETKKFKNTTLDVNQILNQTSGIRIKENGGLGSNYEFSLNGLSGKQIRFFVDGIPVDQLGSSFNLNNITANLVDRIDVYKGVVPVKLGADALGGAVNILTNKEAKSYLDASYSLGSFNTHRATLNSKYRFKNSGFTTKATAFYNYSDNNYTMNNMSVFVNGNEETKDIKRFHDAYTSIMGNVGIGFTSVKWADELMAEVSIASVKQDIQSGIYGTPVGEATEDEDNATYSLKYSKSRLLNNKLDVNLFALYNEINSTSIDTSSNRYNWDGDIIRTENNNLGELVREKTIFEYEQSHFLYRANGHYTFNKSHSISLNHIFSNIERKGENRLNTANNEPFRTPNSLQKTVTGISYKIAFLQDKLENVLALKYYDFDLLTKNAIEYLQGQFEIEDIKTSQENIGYAFSSRYFINPNWYIKASYEKGYRIPQPVEIFGDGLRVLANPSLEPETSHNLNLGMHYSINTNKGFLKNEVNLFQRDVTNFIFIQQSGVFSIYRNVLNVLVRGIEWDFLYTKNNFSLNGNLTWQNVLNNEKYISGTTTESSVYRDRMPNTPYLFANTNVNYNFNNLSNKANVSVYYAINYVHEYYLNYPSVSITSTKNTIPTQFLNNLGITVSSKNRRYNASIEMRNIFDAEAYDNFNLQKPGRAIYLKLRYFLKNNK